VIVLLGLIKMVGNSESTASLEPIAPITAVPATKSTATLPKLESKPTTATAISAAPSSSSTNPLPDLSKGSAQATTTSKNTADQVLIEIQKQNQLLAQQMATLSQRVVSLESSLTQSNQVVEGLSQQLVTMKQPMSASIPTTTPAITTPVTTSIPMPLPSAPQYSVQAVVPQRAWLQSADGNTLTVTVGDDVPGMGVVTSIDPYSGNVSTASGTTIKYAN
jgi:intracellular multiplication protein IcmG